MRRLSFVRAANPVVPRLPCVAAGRGRVKARPPIRIWIRRFEALRVEKDRWSFSGTSLDGIVIYGPARNVKGS